MEYDQVLSVVSIILLSMTVVLMLINCLKHSNKEKESNHNPIPVIHEPLKSEQSQRRAQRQGENYQTVVVNKPVDKNQNLSNSVSKENMNDYNNLPIYNNKANDKNFYVNALKA